MSLAVITELLRQRIGLDPDSLGPTVLSTVVFARQRAVAIKDISLYAARLQNSPAELEALVNDLVVAETWFFRGGELFNYLAAHIRETVAQRSFERPFRILSAPCSTGEEPYSMAIALIEAQVLREAWQIDGCDISQRHLDRATRGRYSAFSFRQMPPQLRDNYFHAQEGGWQIDESIRTTVRFCCGNLIAPDFLSGEPPYHLIFCRNLLIYLHDSARRQVIESILARLAPGGLVAMGHAEPLSAIDERFCHVGPDGLFLFSRRSAAPASESSTARLYVPGKASNLPDTVAAVRRDKPAKVNPRLTKPQSTVTRSLAPVAVVAPADPLAAARRHADAGRLDDAWSDCQRQLAVAGPSADLFALLGVIQQARHELADAKKHFEKALYLDPAHSDALLQLMLLCQQQGAHEQAELLRKRLNRASQQGET
ncbi:MAG: CheR family methyltransferase [Singulisphaera sp.]